MVARICPPDEPTSRSALDIVRVDLARVTSAYFAGAPVYHRMHALEDKLFDMMRPASRLRRIPQVTEIHKNTPNDPLYRNW